MTCPNPANNRACVSLYNGECILPEVRRCCEVRRRRSFCWRQQNGTPKPTTGTKVKEAA